MDLQEALRRTVINRMTRKGINKAELARGSGYTAAHISRMLNRNDSKGIISSIKTLGELAKVLDVKVWEILREADLKANSGKENGDDKKINFEGLKGLVVTELPKHVFLYQNDKDSTELCWSFIIYKYYDDDGIIRLMNGFINFDGGSQFFFGDGDNFDGLNLYDFCGPVGFKSFIDALFVQAKKELGDNWEGD